jgi:hypothetical protein
MKAVNQGKRELELGLRVSLAGVPKVFEYPIGFSVGAASIPGSMITIAPGESLKIRSKGSLFGLRDSGQPAVFIGEANVAVTVKENLYEDDRYFIRAWTEKVVSSNSFKVYWSFEAQQLSVPSKQ